MGDNTTVLIAAASGRSLATSARRGGYLPLVADCFGDADTVAVAETHIRLRSVSGMGIEGDALIAALETLAAARAPCGAVCGTGFEDRPDLLAEVGRRWGLLGNSPETVARIKDPMLFADLCRRCGIPHPEISLARPQNGAGWLVKRAGGAGGRHIRLALADGPAERGYYFQRRVDGTPVSALALADGCRAVLLGFSAQWPSPASHHPFRYGGAARPALLEPQTAKAMADAVRRLVSETGLLGLNSADFLVDGRTFHLLEINPRPGASFDLFEPANDSLFALHVAACRGKLPAHPPVLDGAGAGAVVYSERDIAMMPVLDWPDWTADRPVAGSSVEAGAPLCSVFASAPNAEQARTLVERRAATILATLHARLP
jgi:predicted ATP-grasp superfamily ATP-dependent carboligase